MERNIFFFHIYYWKPYLSQLLLTKRRRRMCGGMRRWKQRWKMTNRIFWAPESKYVKWLWWWNRFSLILLERFYFELKRFDNIPLIKNRRLPQIRIPPLQGSKWNYLWNWKYLLFFLFAAIYKSSCLYILSAQILLFSEWNKLFAKWECSLKEIR